MIRRGLYVVQCFGVLLQYGLPAVQYFAVDLQYMLLTETRLDLRGSACWPLLLLAALVCGGVAGCSELQACMCWASQCGARLQGVASHVTSIHALGACSDNQAKLQTAVSCRPACHGAPAGGQIAGRGEPHANQLIAYTGLMQCSWGLGFKGGTRVMPGPGILEARMVELHT